MAIFHRRRGARDGSDRRSHHSAGSGDARRQGRWLRRVHDRQLRGPYGSNEGLYALGPHVKGSKEQGPQSQLTHAQLYRKGLAGLDAFCKENHGGKVFAELSAEEQDQVLKKIEAGESKLDGVDAQGVFDALLKDVPEGFFSDPIHGGNRDMVGWKMIGFPGIRYDYRDWVKRWWQAYEEIEARGIALLCDWLSPEQCRNSRDANPSMSSARSPASDIAFALAPRPMSMRWTKKGESL